MFLRAASVTESSNLELPMFLGEVPAAPRPATRQKQSVSHSPVAHVTHCASIHLPDITHAPSHGDAQQEDREDLLAIASEAQAYAKLALVMYDADRLSSWLSDAQRRALAEYLRALNLLAVEAHMRATLRLPEEPAALPIKLLGAYLRMFRKDLPRYAARLRLQPYGPDNERPERAPLGEYAPSQAQNVRIQQHFAEIFQG